MEYLGRTLTQGSYVPGQGSWIVGTLAAGDTATMVLDTLVKNGTGGQTITNVATIPTMNDLQLLTE